MRKLILAIAALALLAGCTSPEAQKVRTQIASARDSVMQSTNSATERLNADIASETKAWRAAATRAKTYGDTYGAMCYGGIADILERIDVSPLVPGEVHPLGAFVNGRGIKIMIDNRPAEVKAACKLVRSQTTDDIVGLLSRFGVTLPPLPGL